MTDTLPMQLHGLSLSFKKGQQVLDGVDLELKAGSVTGLLGKNGAGKTTLMRIALGLLRPDSGEARLFGESARNTTTHVRKRIGYVPQTDAPFSWMRVKDCLALVGSFYDTWDTSLINRYLKEWALDPARFIGDLSRGQRQKVAILAAIGHRPELLVLDEPVASLDPGARRQFLKALVELNQDLNHTILFSTHITSDIERVAADVAVLHQGKLRFRGELDTLKEQYRRLYFSGGPLPESLEQPDLMRYEQSGERGEAFARNWSPAKTTALARSLGVSVVAEPLPLEELFLELTHE